MKILTIISITIFYFSNSFFEKTKSNFQPVDFIQKDTLTFGKIPKIWELINDSIRIKRINSLVLINSSQLSPSIEIFNENSVFTIAWNEIGEVNFITTSDSNFKTKENIKIGSTILEIKKQQTTEIHKISGFGYYIRLKSGWNAGFCIDKSCTDQQPKDEDSVTFFFKK